MSDIKFIDGLSWFDPRPNEPDWIKGKISIKLNAFFKFAEEYQDRRGFLNMEVRKSKSTGGIYIALLEPRPETPQEQDAKNEVVIKQEIAELEKKVAPPEEKGEEDEIPF